MCYRYKAVAYAAIFLLLSFCGQNLFAAQDPTRTNSLRGQVDSIRVDDTVNVHDVNFYNIGSTIERTVEIQNVVTVAIDESSPFYIKTDFSVTIDLEIISIAADGSSTTYNKNFTVDYKKAEGTKHNAVSYFAFKNGYWVKVKITGIHPNAGIDWDYKRVLKITNDLTAYRDYIFECNDPIAPPVIVVPATTPTGPIADELKVTWVSPDNGETEYDLEWAWIDESSVAAYMTGNDFIQDKIFTDNATRVTTYKTEYFIPLLYDGEGRLFVRVRVVQIKEGTKQRIEGLWSPTHTGNSNVSGGDMLVFTGHEPNLNWQASTSYAEEGKRKSVVQYFDGTLRNRQTVTKDNTTETITTRPTTVVAETFYDYQGRAVIQVLPAPTLNTVIAFSHNFNQAVGFDGYPKWAYDKLNANGGGVCGDPATAMKTTSGAGQYYSPNNPEAAIGNNKFIPSSTPDGTNAYPFTETRFKADATGKIASQGGVGFTHQIGSTHETKYTDEIPAQSELDVLFGTDVGIYTHYTKNWVKDANGQYSVSYVDMRGRTIATALAGQSPSNLESLDSRNEKNIVKDMIDSSTNIVDGRSIISTGSIVLSQPSDVTLKYAVSPEQLKLLNCQGQQICYDCLYDLIITVTPECNTTVVPGSPFTRRNFTLGDYSGSNNCRPNPGFDETFFIPNLAEGSYNITKELRLSREAQDRHRNEIFMPANTCRNLQTFVTNAYNLITAQANCNITCASCTTALGSNFSQFVNKVAEKAGLALPADTTGMTLQLEEAYAEAKAGCDRICNKDIDDGMGNIRSLRQIMLMDMTPPGGQYAKTDGTSTGLPYNIFSTNTITPTPYNHAFNTKPLYLHPLNSGSGNTLFDNQAYNDEQGNLQLNVAPPASLTTLTPDDFSAYPFDPYWAEALLPYHPEYHKLILSETDLKTSYNYEGRLNDINQWSVAASQNLINNIFGQDPFFSGSSPISTQPIKDEMQNKLNSMLQLPQCNNANLSMLQVALASVNCRNKIDNSTCDPGSLLYCVANQATTGLNPGACADLDYAWKAFKTMYLGERKKLIDRWLRDKCPEINDAQILSYNTATNTAFTLRFPGADGAATIAGVNDIFNQVSSDPNNGTSTVNSAMEDQYDSTCKGYAMLWYSRLMSCPDIASIMTDTDSTEIIDDLRKICKAGSDVDHPVGSSSLPPGVQVGNYENFPQRIKKYLDDHNISISEFCHPYLIEVPKPYDKQVSLVNLPVVTKPSDCQCDQLTRLRLEFENSGTGGNFSQYLEYRYGTYISQGALDTLTALCKGTFPCIFLKDPIIIPPVLQCRGSNTSLPKACINCEELREIIEKYKSEFHTDADVPLEKPDTEQEYAVNNSFELFANNETGFSKSWTEWLAFKIACKGNTEFDCDTLNYVLYLFYASPGYLQNPTGTNCRQLFTTFFNNHFNKFWSFEQWMQVFTAACKYTPDVCKPRITCESLTAIIKDYYSLYGVAVIQNQNCQIMFANYFNMRMQTDGSYTYEKIKGLYKLLCQCDIDVCSFPNCVQLDIMYVSFKQHFGNTLWGNENCKDSFVIYFNNYFGLGNGSQYDWDKIYNLFHDCKKTSCGKYDLEGLCDPPYSCETLKKLIEHFHAYYKRLGIDISATPNCQDSFKVFFNQQMGTSYTFVQIAALYFAICKDQLKVCDPNYECKEMIALIEEFKDSVIYNESNCKEKFLEYFNLYYGTSYTSYQDIVDLYKKYCEEELKLCDEKIEITNCEQLKAFLQKFLEKHPDPQTEFGNECQQVFTALFNEEFGKDYTYEKIVNYYLACNVKLEVCKSACENIYSIIFDKMPKLVCSGLKLPLLAGQDLFVSLFNQTLKQLNEKSDAELSMLMDKADIEQFRQIAKQEYKYEDVMKLMQNCGGSYTGCLALINPALEGQNQNIYDRDVLLSLKTAYYLMHPGGLPEDCKNDFTSWVNMVMQVKLDYETLADIYQSVAGPGTQYICDTPPADKGDGITLKDNSSSNPPSYGTQPLLCGLNNAVFTDGPTNPNPCSDLLNIATGQAEDEFEIYKDSLRNVFDTAYLNKCLSIRKAEQFTVTYKVSEYHYTLYYYDQAGNLVRTIPPAGVQKFTETNWEDLVKIARENGTAKIPPHTMPTDYRYNTLNRVVAQKTPDAGVSKFWYDRLGRLVISQNAKQASNSQYSYTLYDDLGRIQEVGQLPHTGATILQSTAQNKDLFAAWIASSGTKEQVTKTIYDVPYTPLCGGIGTTVLCQQNLRNRVSYTYIESLTDNNPTTWDAATFYSYDIHGNVDVLLQDYQKGMGEFVCTNNGNTQPSGSRFKKIQYEHDLISGNVSKVSYQGNEADAFYHRYEYDAENRIIGAFTSRDEIYWENDVKYSYYKHGPLSRLVLSESQVQGIDYAYTLHGWLKGVNSTSVGDGNFDIGEDGKLTGSLSPIARDAFSFSLNYFGSDYIPIESSVSNVFCVIPNTLAPLTDNINTGGNLYNGNVRGMLVNIPKIGDARLYGYRYDQLNRIIAMNSYNGFDNINNIFNSSTPLVTNQYKERISYDANGNILSYLRNGDAVRESLDDMVYSYRSGTNQLDKVVDAVLDVDDADYYKYNDIKRKQPDGTLLGQHDGNYTYDKIGNLTADVAEGITDIGWNVYGKISSITKTINNQTTHIYYKYDASGNRISKKVNNKATYYVRDASGNVMSVYEEGNGDIENGSLTQTELHLYGSSRLGVYNLQTNMQCILVNSDGIYTFTKGSKFFELANHLGNVLVTVSDKKIGHDAGNGTIDYYTADVVTANDYYPGGMIMPGRKYSQPNCNYRYGFNTQERDRELNENIYTAEYWEYDSRILRRWNIDPVEDVGVSGYATNRNNPNVFSDPDGDFPFLPFIIGFVSDVVAQGVSNLLNGKPFFHEINYYSAVVSGLSAQFGGALSATKFFNTGSQMTVLTKQALSEVVVSTAESATKQLLENGNIDPLKLVTDVAGDFVGNKVTKNVNSGGIKKAEENLDRAVRKTKSRSATRQKIKVKPAEKALQNQQAVQIVSNENANNFFQEAFNQYRKLDENLNKKQVIAQDNQSKEGETKPLKPVTTPKQRTKKKLSGEEKQKLYEAHYWKYGRLPIWGKDENGNKIQIGDMHNPNYKPPKF